VVRLGVMNNGAMKPAHWRSLLIALTNNRFN